MIITKKEDICAKMDKIQKSHHGNLYRIVVTGEMVVNGSFISYGFMVYRDGHWYCRKGDAIKFSKDIPENGTFLLGMSNKRFCMIQDYGTAEYASASVPLSKDTRLFFFTEQEDGICLTIADGQKSKIPYNLLGERTVASADMMAMLMLALVRQYDVDAANRMEEFWFPKSTENDDCQEEKENLPW